MLLRLVQGEGRKDGEDVVELRAQDDKEVEALLLGSGSHGGLRRSATDQRLLEERKMAS